MTMKGQIIMKRPDEQLALPLPLGTLGPTLIAMLFLALSGGVAAQEDPPLVTDSYVIGVGDLLTVSVWNSPELTAQVPVRPDGMITVPLVGDVLVAGSEPGPVRELLNEKFSAFVSAPTISVVVNEINSRKIYIVGEVASSGAYDIVQPLRMMQALALAGGLSEYAKKDQVVLLRQDKDLEKRIILSIKAIASGKKPADNIRLQPGDTIIVP